ncbi:MAG: rhomboid family intramembrane serine protease [Flavobacterium sp. MedPE-SWcel]|uniref:rhomboid family intramembrane serine protease n=1 Tax=uncultured Flavobacterium sp. TaxID=165435 RepID=UPI00091C41FE|nr:rhomboid family intramembrane serine protease [uncultured Flavobacterium sp.]OIQ21036.1 MAG: rhomboid family intramembrane serine protease [Flavobacterium sp. MedPE-SWcel]
MGLIDDLKLEYKVGGITQRLIFWNVGLFVIPMILFSLVSLFGVNLSFLRWDLPGTVDWLSLSSNPSDLLWKPWSVITYAFLHGGFLHLLFNMMVLYFSGRLFLTFFTQKQLFGLYILSTIFAGLIFVLSYNTIPLFTALGSSKMVGASAAIMAILVATAVYSPDYRVKMMLIGTVKLWHIALVFIILDLINVSVENQGGHVAHLSGALFGYIFIKTLQGGTDLTKSVSVVVTFFQYLFKPKNKSPFKKVHKNKKQSGGTSRRPVGKAKNYTQKQIDDILDKISQSGYDSLTKEEKDFLFRAGK